MSVPKIVLKEKDSGGKVVCILMCILMAALLIALTFRIKKLCCIYRMLTKHEHRNADFSECESEVAEAEQSE